MTTWFIYGGIFALGVLTKCLWDFLWDALDRRHDRKYAERHAQRRLIGSSMDEIPASSPATAPKLELIRTAGAPEGYSAAQVLGYYAGGSRWVDPQFPGGLDAWDRRNAEQA